MTTIAATSVIVACRSELSVHGTLAVDVAGLGTRPMPGDGGKVVVTANGGQAASSPDTLPIAGSWTGALPDGDYVVAYAPPGGYMLASGETGTRTTHMSAGEISRVRFNVSVDSGAIGTITLSVAGLSEFCLADGGSAVLQRTDVTQGSQTVAVPRMGKDTVTVVAGTYRVLYNPATSYVAVGTSRIVGLSVAARGEAAAAFVVRPMPASLLVVADIAGPPWPLDGGTVSLLRADTAGQVPYTTPVLVTDGYYAEVDGIRPGVYSVAYTPPSGFQLAAGAKNPVDGLVLCAGAAQVTFAVAPSAH